MRDFNEWLGKMRPSINNYNYYVDFEKVYANVENIRELQIHRPSGFKSGKSEHRRSRSDGAGLLEKGTEIIPAKYT